jgi:hypothetical protein
VYCFLNELCSLTQLRARVCIKLWNHEDELLWQRNWLSYSLSLSRSVKHVLTPGPKHQFCCIVNSKVWKLSIHTCSYSH